MNNFKVGDKVKCIEPGDGLGLSRDSIYVVEDVYTLDDIIKVVTDYGVTDWVYGRRFQIAQCVQKTEQEIIQIIMNRYKVYLGSHASPTMPSRLFVLEEVLKDIGYKVHTETTTSYKAKRI